MTTAARSKGILHARADVGLAQPPVKVRFQHRPGGLRRGATDDQRPLFFPGESKVHSATLPKPVGQRSLYFIDQNAAS